MQAAGTKKSTAQGGLIVVLGNGENKGINQKTGIIGGREENKTKKKVEELVGVEKKAGGQPGGDEDKQEGEPSATQSGLQVTIKGSETGSLEADEQRLEIASIGAPELRVSVLTRGSGKPVKEGDLEEAEKDDVSISSDSEPMEDDDRCDEEEHVAREIIRWMHLQDKSAEEMTNSHDFVSPPLKLLALATVDKDVTDFLEILGLERSGMSQKSHQKVGQNKALIPGKTVTFEYSFRSRSRTGFSLFRYHFIILHFTFEKQTYFHEFTIASLIV